MPTPVKWVPDFLVAPFVGAVNVFASVIALPNGRFEVGSTSYFQSDSDVDLMAFSAAGVALGRIDSPEEDSTAQGGVRDGAYIQGAALADGRKVYVWTESPVGGGGNGRDVYATVRLGDDLQGTTQVARFLVAGGVGDQIQPVVVGNAVTGGFAIALNNVQTGNAEVRFYEADGELRFTRVLGPTSNYGESTYPSVDIAALQNGNYVIFRDAPGTGGVIGQIYDNIGFLPVGGPIALTDPTSDSEQAPAVATLADGRFVVVYYDNRDGPAGVSAQIFNEDGTSFLADIDVGSNPDIPPLGRFDVAALLDGRFIVVWVTAGEIKGQVMFANGAKDGSVFTVNEFGAQDQFFPSVATLADGRFVVSWSNTLNGFLSSTQATIFDPRETNINMSGSSFGDEAFGTSFNDAYYAGAGNDTVFGQGGLDYILGEAGNDSLNGGAATDLLYGGAGADFVFGEEGADFVYGGLGNDTVSGGSDNDVVYGDAGNDQVYGLEGNDTLIGGDGDDYMSGGSDNDAMDGGAGADTLVAMLGDDFARGGAGDDQLNGDAGADLLYGDAGNDAIYGDRIGVPSQFDDGGADTIYGGAGNDTAEGGLGGDVLIGEAGQDNLRGGGGDDSLDGGADGDTLLGENGNDFLQGQDGDDILDGGADVDDLRGGNGNDTITGGSGGDTMYGNAGNDVFRFAVGSGADAIVGWEDGLDRIDITTYAGATFANTVITQVGADTRVTFVSGDSVLLIGVTAATVTLADFIV